MTVSSSLTVSFSGIERFLTLPERSSYITKQQVLPLGRKVAEKSKEVFQRQDVL